MFKNVKGSRKSGVRPGSRYKKRKGFMGTVNELETEYATTSAQKLATSPDFAPTVTVTAAYVMLHFFSVFSELSNIIKCKNCDGSINFSKKSEKGLGFKLIVECNCGERVIESCPRIANKAYEINRRIVFVMRILGVGLNGLHCFTSLMDIGEFTKHIYYAALDNAHTACIGVFSSVIKKASKEEKEKTDESEDKKFTASGDGSWSKRGHTANYGVMTLIGNKTNKVLDLTVKSRYCQGCNLMKTKKGTPEYDTWWDEHEPVCTLDHNGSSGKMEPDGMLEMFERAFDLHGRIYERYVGDGDVKIMNALQKSFPNVVKAECINHVGKRIGSQLRGVIKKTKRTDQLGGAGPGKLTGNMITELTTYYELAIRRNAHSAEEMAKEIWATYYHKISTDENPQHQNCPEGPESWCKWKRAEAANELSKFHHDKPPLDPKVRTAIYPVYVKLTDPDLLKKCEGGFTQNNNESFNATIWQMAPKHTYSGKKIIEVAALTAACMFNEGFLPVLLIMQVMGIKIGYAARAFANERDRDRLQDADRGLVYNSHEARTARKKAKMQLEDQFEVVEGIVYGPGIDV